MSPGPQELIIILVIVLLLFGAKRLPALAGSLGQSMKEFRRATNDAAEDEKPHAEPDTPAGPATS